MLGLLNSAVAAYYYLRILLVMYMREPSEATAELPPLSAGLRAALLIPAVGTLFLGILPMRRCCRSAPLGLSTAHARRPRTRRLTISLLGCGGEPLWPHPDKICDTPGISDRVELARYLRLRRLHGSIAVVNPRGELYETRAPAALEDSYNGMCRKSAGSLASLSVCSPKQERPIMLRTFTPTYQDAVGIFAFDPVELIAGYLPGRQRRLMYEPRHS